MHKLTPLPPIMVAAAAALLLVSATATAGRTATGRADDVPVIFHEWVGNQVSLPLAPGFSQDVGGANGLAAVAAALAHNASATGKPVPSAVAPIPGLAPAAKPPAPGFTFQPPLSGPDPQIAVGEHFAIATEGWSLEFLDKEGHQLPSLPGGVPTLLNTRSFFHSFLESKLADGSDNTNDINRYLITPVPCDVEHWNPDPEPQVGNPNVGGCVSNFYDARVAYDQLHNRFIIESSVRPLISGQPGDGRYTAFAVSIGEDPRQGFYQYMLTTNIHYMGDWPLIAVSKHALLIGHMGPLVETARPALVAVSLDDMKQGIHQPAFWTPTLGQFGGHGWIIPVQNIGDSAKVWLLNPATSPAKVWAFDDTNLSSGTPTLTGADLHEQSGPIDLQVCSSSQPVCMALNTTSVVTTPVYHDGTIYVAGYMAPPSQPKAVRFIEINVTEGATISAAIDPTLDLVIGGTATGENPNDKIDYVLPAVAVTNKGDAVVAYRRGAVSPTSTAEPFWDDFRYSILYHGTHTFSASQRLSPKLSPTNTPGVTRLDDPSAQLDPDGQRIWIAGSYRANATADSATMTVGWVRP
jgi:hypothetical protein